MKTRLRHLVSALALAVFVCIAFGSANDRSGKKSEEQNATEKIANDASMTEAQKDSLLSIAGNKEIEKRKALTVSAVDLHDAYQENEVSADNYYKGKWIYVEGTVEEVGKGFLKQVYIGLKTRGAIGRVICYVENPDMTAQLKSGQQITIFGRCEGLKLQVLMKDCEVVENLSDLME